MKNLLFMLSFVVAAFFTSCTTVYFKQPQPAGVKNLPEFPESVRGWYASGTDSMRIVNFGVFVIEHKSRQVALKDTKERNISKDANGKWIFPPDAEATYTAKEEKNDSLYYIKTLKTLKRLGPDTLLRVYKKDYYLSMRKDNRWEVLLLKQGKKGYIAIEAAFLDAKESKDMLNRIGASGKDSSGVYSRVSTFTHVGGEDPYYLTDPSAEELQKLIRKGLFKPLATFQRVK